MTLACKEKGFTLIELMVVVVIMTTVMSLVGGITVNTLSSFKVRAEEKQLLSVTRQASQSAFVSEKQVTLVLNEDRLLINTATKTYQQHFEHISFVKQELRFNRQGLPSARFISYIAKGQPRRLDLQVAINAS